MNYHSDQWIIDRVQEHYNEALESFPRIELLVFSIKVVETTASIMKAQMLILN